MSWCLPAPTLILLPSKPSFINVGSSIVSYESGLIVHYSGQGASAKNGLVAGRFLTRAWIGCGATASVLESESLPNNSSQSRRNSNCQGRNLWHSCKSIRCFSSWSLEVWSDFLLFYFFTLLNKGSPLAFSISCCPLCRRDSASALWQTPVQKRSKRQKSIQMPSIAHMQITYRSRFT